MTISDLSTIAVINTPPLPYSPPPSSNSTPTSSVVDETITVGPLLTVTRIQTIGELLANSIDIEKEYFSNTGQTSSDYENFLKVNGKIITFTDSLGTIYKVPTTYINWPPYQNGYPYQIMGANIAIGPFEATADLTSEVSYLSCVIESITGITPNLTLVELSDVYLVDKYSSNIIESVRYNNINGPGTFMYYKNMSESIQNDISAIAGVLGLSKTVQYGLVNELGCFGSSVSTTPTTSSTPTNEDIAIFGGGYTSSDATLSTTSIYTYSSNSTAAGTNLSYSVGGLAAVSSNNIGVIN